MSFSSLFYIEVQKEYVFLCVKKWREFSAKEDLIPKIDCDFYVTESFKVTKSGAKPSCVLHVVIDGSLLSSLSLEIYLDRLYGYIKDTFPTARRAKNEV